ncbi:MAG: RsmE family RNA methyltransferase [Acidobacteriota bacterium]
MNLRFFADVDLASGATVELTSDERHHARVVRVRDGEEVEVFNGRGAGFFGIYQNDAIRLTTPAPDRESPVAVHLAMAIIQLEKFELVLQKATELGVRSIIPMVTERVEVRPERYRGKQERWRKIIFEAVKQSGRKRIPELEEPVEFKDVIAREGLKIVFDADAPATQSPSNPATLLIGPEGGFSDDELQAARDRGCAFDRLGPRRLRAETAAIVAAAIITARCGGF